MFGGEDRRGKGWEERIGRKDKIGWEEKLGLKNMICLDSGGYLFFI